ncbi:MAG TPA: hypothetical protein VKV17_18875 [Bryobacteraceae bacterium]|nr:hypothetical protein [Bryobacteraceae bacterium]
MKLEHRNHSRSTLSEPRPSGSGPRLLPPVARLLSPLLLAAAAFAQPPLKVVATSPAGSPALTMRQAVSDEEKHLDTKLSQVGGKDKVYILGLARGLYLAGYGAVFTQELDLIETPHLNPFHQQITPQEAAAVRQRKLENLAVLRKSLRDLWADAAAGLSPMPDTEQVVLAVRLLYQPWEDRSGLPSQIVLKGSRKASPASISVEEQ